MSLELPLFCSECKTVVADLSKLIFTSKEDPRSFCSEECLKNHFKILKIALENSLESLDCGFNQESIVDYATEPSFVNHLLQFPDDVYELKNEQIQSVYLLLKKFVLDELSFTLGVFCFIYGKDPSYIVSTFVVEDANKLKNFLSDDQRYHEWKSPSMFKADSFDIEDLESLEFKKSQLISELITLRDENDIPFESFMSYESFLEPTLQSSDEIWERKDDEGDTIVTYIKTFVKEEDCFTYFALYLIPEEGRAPSRVLSFPSCDSATYEKFSGGKLIYRDLRN